MSNPPAVLGTVDTFIAKVDTGPDRCICVYRREHGGKRYLRWRTWHRHKTRGVWYPDTRRGGVLPLEAAQGLAEAFQAAARGEPQEPLPAFLAHYQDRAGARPPKLRDLAAPPDRVAEAERRQHKLP